MADDMLTIKVTPILDTETAAALDATLREAVADSLRRLADELTAKATSASADEPRYSLVNHDGAWGILDRERPDAWARYEPSVYAKEDVEADFADLMAGADLTQWEWTPKPTA